MGGGGGQFLQEEIGSLGANSFLKSSPHIYKMGFALKESKQKVTNVAPLRTGFVQK